MGKRTITLVVLCTVVFAGCLGGGGAGAGDAPTNDTTTTPPSTVTPEDPITDDPPSTSTPEDPITHTPHTETPTTTPTGTDDGYYNSFTFKATPVSMQGIAEDLSRSLSELGRHQRAVVAAAFENGSATVTDLEYGEGPPESVGPVEDGTVVRRNGTFYRVETTVLEWRSDSGYSFEFVGPLRETRTEYSPDEVNATPLSSLSTVEQNVATLKMPGEREVVGDKRRPVHSVVASFNFLPREGASLQGSEFLDGEPHFVKNGGDVFLIEFENERPTMTRSQVKYTLEPVADSPEAFLEGRLDGLVHNVTADVPPEPVRGILLSAIENGTYEWTGTVEGRPEAVEAADGWVGDRSPSHSVAYLRYEGQVYRIQVREVIE